MRPRLVYVIVTLGLTLAAGLVFVGWPPEAATAPLAPPPAESRLTLPPPKPGHARPLVVVLADNASTETTDFTIPYGVLKESGAADVISVSTHPGPVHLQMAFTVLADQTAAQFDAAHPEGADLVVIPYLAKPDVPALSRWLRAQYAHGAVVMSICAGAENLAQAGLLDRHRATTHWHFIGRLEKTYPTTTWVRDRRYVQDGRIITTTGVSASIPASLAVVEAIGGRDLAAATAARLGVSDWSAAHHSADFPFDGGDLSQAGMTLASPWNHERLEAPVSPGFDEIGLALTADAWSSTFRASVVATSAGAAPIRSRHGLLLVPDARPAAQPRLLPRHPGAPVAQLDLALADIARRYGPGVATVSAKGLEYPWRP
jgi:putative intracellular protease/amidase